MGEIKDNIKELEKSGWKLFEPKAIGGMMYSLAMLPGLLPMELQRIECPVENCDHDIELSRILAGDPSLIKAPGPLPIGTWECSCGALITLIEGEAMFHKREG